MILGHDIQWIRGKLWPNDKFWPLLLENLRKIEKTINFSSKSRNFKKCVPGLQLAPNSSGTNFRMFRLILEISTMVFFRICDILEFEFFGSKILFISYIYSKRLQKGQNFHIFLTGITKGTKKLLSTYLKRF